MKEVREAGDRVEKRSKEVEEFSLEAKRVYDEGMEAAQTAQCRQSELDDLNKQLDVRVTTVQQLEGKLKEEQDKHHIERAILERDKEANRCFKCRTPLPPQQQQYNNMFLAQQQQQFVMQQQQQQLQQQQHQQQQQQMVHPVSPYQLNTTPVHFKQMNNSNMSPAMVTTPNQSLYNQIPPIQQQQPLQQQQQQHSLHRTSTPDADMTLQPLGPNLTYSIDKRTYSVDSLMGILNNQNTPPPTPDVQIPNAPEAGDLPPPDILMNSFEYKRAMRRYSHEKDKDDNYLEEETRFLKMLHEKRIR